ncbi:MAG: efflux RND transporter permease subunit [Rhodospirillaceae bacterium]|nr:efflux RND transporter permease subunit [Rhodospirillaceae bacterium]
MKLGISGNLTRAFIRSPLTPLLLMASIIVGALALVSLPREEEPQISVPLVDIHVTANGLKADDAVELVTKPLEIIVKSALDVEHVYSQTVDDGVVVTARFKVGTDEDEAILRIHEKVRANLNRLPTGIPEPLIVKRGINDVAIVALTLAPKPGASTRWTDNALFHLAEKLQAELAKVEDVGLTYIVGGRPDQIRIEPNPERLTQYGVTLKQLVDKVEGANRTLRAGAVRQNDRSLDVTAGATLKTPSDFSLLLITTTDGRPVYLKDVADVVVGARPDEHRAWHITRQKDGSLDTKPAVTLAIAKRKGANAVVLAEELLHRLNTLKAGLIPADVTVEVTRNYGETAAEKADELLLHLGIAAVSIAILIVFAVGWREGIVVVVVVPTTILLTLFASWLMGYTINRVSLFALIFSIGILVDDAIVVVENIVRHWRMRDGRSTVQAAIDAVAEVGNPTIIATLTVVAALLPMMFVSGLMGPYMSPIPANASAAMLLSFFVAVVVTPWLMLKVHGRAAASGHAGGHGGGHGEEGGALGKLYRLFAVPLLKGRRRAKIFLAIITGATLASCVLFYTRDVTVKLLPFDNKSELQVVIDLPEGSSLEATDRVLQAAAAELKDLKELASIQSYAGTSAPFNFNGLVRHYYLRDRPNQGDLQINLLPKGERDRASHDIALDVRKRLAKLALPAGTRLKVVEVPPGPPVLSTLLAEVYGPTAEARRETTRKLRDLFKSVDFIVDVDDSLGQVAERVRFVIDQESLEFHGVEQSNVFDTIAALMNGVRVGYSHRGAEVYPMEITIRLPRSALALGERLLSTPVPSKNGFVELGDVVQIRREPTSLPIFRHNGRYAEMVLAELAGRYESPIYGMLAVEDAIKKAAWGTLGAPKVSYHGQPEDESKTTVLWDGEWEVTFVTFRDMGAAFAVAILAIYLLVVGQFGSFRLPLLILVPVPLTLIGIVFGHWLFGAAFTATSMIGFIALAGIIVRNSILLVDFIQHQRATGVKLRQALIEAGSIRFKPIVLTAAAAMIGAGFILFDPIFQGLAISLLFGLASSTALTVLVIPAIYVWLRDDERGTPTPPPQAGPTPDESGLATAAPTEGNPAP